MNIAGVNAYRAVQDVAKLDVAAAPESSGFTDLLSKALNQLGELQGKADDAMTRVATGQPIELHEAMLAMEEASVGVQLAMQVRNKIIEAYQDVMRTQV